MTLSVANQSGSWAPNNFDPFWNWAERPWPARPHRVTGDNHSMSDGAEEREGLTFTHLDEELFDGAGATKRDLVDYVDAVSARLVSSLRDRPLSGVRVPPGQPAFMQKKLPKNTPGWVQRVPIWAEASRREISYALANDRRT